MILLSTLWWWWRRTRLVKRARICIVYEWWRSHNTDPMIVVINNAYKASNIALMSCLKIYIYEKKRITQQRMVERTMIMEISLTETFFYTHFFSWIFRLSCGRRRERKITTKASKCRKKNFCLCDRTWGKVESWVKLVSLYFCCFFPMFGSLKQRRKYDENFFIYILFSQYDDIRFKIDFLFSSYIFAIATFTS
jgi:hypothetical protein